MKLALVHDWLTGMRGGEKVLEVLCAMYPSADLLTLVHVPVQAVLSLCRFHPTTCTPKDHPTHGSGSLRTTDMLGLSTLSVNSGS